jgi:chemotaxis protein methyltransferase CheR
MAHPIDTTLALLQDVMTAHREALSRGPAGAPAAVSLPRDTRADLVLRLLAGIESRAGIEVSQPAAEKLLRGLSVIDSAELEAWVAKLESLPASHPEWLALIEGMTVHETYVMRDPAQLQHFAAQLPALIASAEPTRSLRFWSVGCATGEEAYSVAALTFDVLLELGHAVATERGVNLIPPWRLEILGSDVSRKVLDQAKNGIYETGPLSSFRAESAVLLRHFPAAPKSVPGKARVAAPYLKDVVQFSHFNIMDGAAPLSAFDAVFCRNVLIYFSGRARRIALNVLARAVRPGGYLILGPTDSLVDGGAFEAIWGEDAVIYRRRPGDE